MDLSSPGVCPLSPGSLHLQTQKQWRVLAAPAPAAPPPPTPHPRVSAEPFSSKDHSPSLGKACLQAWGRENTGHAETSHWRPRQRGGPAPNTESSKASRAQRWQATRKEATSRNLTLLTRLMIQNNYSSYSQYDEEGQPEHPGQLRRETATHTAAGETARPLRQSASPPPPSTAHTTTLTPTTAGIHHDRPAAS